MPGNYKVSTNTSSLGTAAKFGAADINRITQTLNGDADVDSPDINSPLTLHSSKLFINNPANTFAYTVIASALAADRDLIIPLLTGSDTLAVLSLDQTFSNKTLDSSCIVDSATLGADVVTLTGTQTLTNKTLTLPIISAVSNSGTVTFPTGTITLASLSGTENLTNKTLDSTNTISSATSLPTVTVAKGGTGQTTATAGFDALSPMTTAGDLIYGGASGTRTRLATGTSNQLLRVNAGATAPEWASTLSGLTLTAPIISTISNTGTITLPTSTDTLVGKATTDTLTNKTLTSPIITTIVNSGNNLTLPTTTDTIVGRATTDTLTNKTLTTPTLTTPIINGLTYGDVAITSASSPYTVLATTGVIRADASGGAITINLPTAVGIAGREYKIYRTDVASSTNIITIDANSTETIDSNLTYRLYTAEWIHLESDGANWQVIARPNPNVLGYYMLKNTANIWWVAGQLSAPSAPLTSTTSPAANTLWALPLIISRTTKFDNISWSQSSVSTAGHSRVGIYADNGNAYPGVLIFDSGTIDTTSTGTKNNSLSNLILQPGLYWLAYEQDTATGQMRILPAVGTCFGVFGVNLANTAVNVYFYTVAHTYGALPDPYTAGATLANTASAAGTPVPMIGLHCI